MVATTDSRSGQYIKANGLNVYYEEYGTGKPLVLLHGGMASVRMLDPLIAFFSEQFKVIAPDLRGHGKTDNPTGQLTYRSMADDVAAFIDALKIEQPSVCGWSDGGQIALELGMHYPDMMKCMVAGAVWYQFSQQYQNMLKVMGIESPEHVNFETVSRVLPQLVEAWRIFHATAEDPNRWQTLATQISSMWWTPLGYTREDFQKIKTPILILLGDRDQIVPVEEAVEMHRLVQGSELAIVPHADHSLPRSHPELFTAMVLDFLIRHV